MSGVNWRQAGHAFEEYVAVGEEADDEPFGQVILADDDFAEFVEQRAHECAGFLHRLVDGIDSGIHYEREITEKQTGNPAGVFNQITHKGRARQSFARRNCQPTRSGCSRRRASRDGGTPCLEAHGQPSIPPDGSALGP
jgi:hypothetical protein